METRIAVAMVLGYSSAIYCGYRGAKSVINRIRSRPSNVTPKRNLVWPLGIAGAAIGAGAGFFLAGIIGGTFGLILGQLASSSLGIGIFGAPIGLALGIFLVFNAITLAGALCGAILGRLLNHVQFQSPAT